MELADYITVYSVLLLARVQYARISMSALPNMQLRGEFEAVAGEQIHRSFHHKGRFKPKSGSSLVLWRGVYIYILAKLLHSGYYSNLWKSFFVHPPIPENPGVQLIIAVLALYMTSNMFSIQRKGYPHVDDLCELPGSSNDRMHDTVRRGFLRYAENNRGISPHQSLVDALFYLLHSWLVTNR